MPLMRLSTSARATAILALLLSLPAPAVGQTTTAGQIVGRVAAENQDPLVGVLVSVANTETGFMRTALTRSDGTFGTPLLPPGSYDIRASFLGYRSALIRNVRVTAGTTTVVNVQLQVSALQMDSVIVSAVASSVADAPGATVVSRDEIEKLPSLGRDYTDFIALSSRVAPSPEITTGGQLSIAGQRPSQTNLQIDGVDANNAFFGDSRGGSRIPFSFSLESIREFQVISNGYDVEYGRYGGGVINVITRGGTNDFEATVFGNLRDRALTGRYFTPVIALGDTLRRPVGYEVLQYGMRVSGPVIRNRLHFLFSVDGQRRREPFTPVTPELYLQRGDTVTFHALNRFLSILEGRYGIAGVGERYRPFLTTNDVVTLFGRIDYTLNRSHRLALRHNYASFSNDNEPAAGTLSFFGGRSAVERIENVSHSLVGELQSVLGARTSNVLRFEYSSEARPRTATEQRAELRVTLPNRDVVQYGGHHIGFQNRLAERKVQIINYLTRQQGSHGFKVGAMGLWTRVRNRFIGNAGAGIFQFNSLDDLDAYRPVSYERRLRADGQVPHYQFDVLAGAIAAQHEWRPSMRLTTTVGLRYDVESFRDAPVRIEAVETTFGARTDVVPSDRNNISPRVTIAFDPRADGRTVIRAGAGYFYGPIPYVLAGNILQTELPVLALTCRGAVGTASAPPSPSDYATWDARTGSDNPVTCGGGGGLSGLPEYNLWHPSFEVPEILKTSIGLARQLGPDTRISVDVMHTHGAGLYTVKNLNLRAAQFELAAEANRRIYTPPQSFTPRRGAGGLQYRESPAFARVLVSLNDAEFEATQLNAEFVHHAGRRLVVRGGYTFSRAFDNSSFSCCALVEGYEGTRIGAYGPNEIGGRGDTEHGWGPSDLNRPHTFVLAGSAQPASKLRISAMWRIHSGSAWTPEQGGDLNGDGVLFNDRPFIYAPEVLPVDPQLSAEQQQIHRARYAEYLANHECVRAFVGRIVPRNRCRNPAYNRLDLSAAYNFPTRRSQSAEVAVDAFNVLNLLNERWGRYEGVAGPRKSLLDPQSFVPGPGGPGDGAIRYQVPAVFGERRELGTNLMLQWQLQLSVRYRFSQG